MSDDSSSGFFSAYGDSLGDCAIRAADERSEAGWTEAQSLTTALEENGWADYYGRNGVVSEEEADLGITERAEASSNGQYVPEASPGKLRDDNLPAGILVRGASGAAGLEGLVRTDIDHIYAPTYPAHISEGTDVLRAEANSWDTETAISPAVFESALQEHIIVDVPPRATTNGIAQPTGGERLPIISFDGAAINHRSVRDEAGPAPRSDTPDDARSPPGHKKSKQRKQNGKPSSKQEHREDHHRAQGNSSRTAEAPRRRESGRNGSNTRQRRLEIPPLPTPSRSRNRSRDHTRSTVRPDPGSGSALVNVNHLRRPRSDSDEAHLYKGFCWGWKPSWWPEAWRWPSTTK